MSSKKSISKENDDTSNQTTCNFCGCGISDSQITMWHEENHFHTECYQINTTKMKDAKEKGLGLIISRVKIVDSTYELGKPQSKGPLPKISR